MSISIVTGSESIKNGVRIVNGLDSSKFPLLLTRIMKTLHSKEEMSFSETEKSKLESSLSLSAEDVKLLLETLHFILEQAAYHLAKPSTLLQQLLQLGMEEDKASVLIQSWTNSAKGVVEKLAQRNITPHHLEDVDWRLHLQMAHSSKSKLAQPIALFEFSVQNDVDKSKDNFNVEFSHEELYSFFGQLETIQAQLDSLR